MTRTLRLFEGIGIELEQLFIEVAEVFVGVRQKTLPSGSDQCLTFRSHSSLF